MKAAQLMLELLDELGAEYIFGNPGSTEAPLMQALTSAKGRPRFVLGLQEATVVGMADGYSAVTRKPTFVNLHTVSGLGNGLGAIVNARNNLAPLVITAGQQDRRHLVTDPFLGGDLLGLAAGAAKWGKEVTRVGDLEIILRRAYQDAAVAPAGPVFVSLPIDLLDEEVSGISGGSTPTPRGSVPEELDVLADKLLSTPAGKLAIVAGDEVADSHASDTLVTLAERLGAQVYGASLYGRGVFPPAHALWRGTLPATTDGLRRALGEYDRVLLLGGRVLILYTYAEGTPLAEGVEFLQVSPDPYELGRNWPLSWGGVGGIFETVTALDKVIEKRSVDGAASVLEERQAARAAEIASRDETARARYSTDPPHPMAAVHAVFSAIPHDTLVVDEAVSAGAYVRGFHRPARAGRYFFCRGGGLGWGMPAAVGVSLGAGRESVLCIVGDGAACYSPQALWTAATERLPVVFVVIDNGGYGILRSGLQARMGKDTDPASFVGTDIRGPEVSFAELGKAFGVGHHAVAHIDHLGDAVQAAVDSGEPSIVHFRIGDMV